MAIHQTIYVPKSWRSEILWMAIFIVTTVLSLLATRWMPGSIITGELFTISDSRVMLSLPLFWLLPAGVLIRSIIRIYDVKFWLDNKGIYCVEGILSLSKRSTTIKFEDVRATEIKQSLLDRLLGIGDIEMGTAATEGVEVIFHGVAEPVEVQQLIQAEVDFRKQLMREATTQRRTPVKDQVGKDVSDSKSKVRVYGEAIDAKSGSGEANSRTTSPKEISESSI